MKKIQNNSLSNINGGGKAPGCGTIGAMWVFTGVGANTISFNFWNTLAGVCWDN